MNGWMDKRMDGWMNGAFEIILNSFLESGMVKA
jgi:hypothetical protein